MASALTNWEVYILKPAERTNLVTNPSFETGTTGYTTVNSAVATSTAKQIRGLQSMSVTPTNANEAGAYYTLALTNAQPYYLSCDVYTEAGKTYTLRVTDAADALKATASFTGAGFWQRKSVLFTADAGANFRFKILRDGGQSTTAVWYIDGVQIENAATESSYIDGDQDLYGYGLLRDIQEYRWNGTAHAATSTRIGDTRAGGTYVRLRDYARTMSINGGGLTSFNTVATQLVKGGSMYQWSRANSRKFNIAIEFDAVVSANTPGKYHEAMAALENALDPEAVKYPQPVRLIFVGKDANAIECTERLMVDCSYTGGLEGNLTDYYINKTVLTFEHFDYKIKKDGNPGQALGYQTQTNFYELASLNLHTGAWSAEGISASADPADYARDMELDAAGGLYLAGSFLNLNGDANQDNIAYRSAAGVWSALGAGLSAVANAVTVHPSGIVYIGGDFDNAGADAAADHICKWTGGALSSVNASYPNDTVSALCVSANGNLYAGGAFTAVGAIANTARIAYWTGSAWTSLGTQPDGGIVSCIIPDPASNGVIIGGTFTNAGGTAANDYLVRYDGTAYSLIGSAAPDGIVSGLVYDDKSGRLYVVGAFHNIGGIASEHAAYWDGSNWNAIVGLSVPGFPWRKCAMLPNGNIIYAATPSWAALGFGQYNGSVILQMDFFAGATSASHCTYYDKATHKVFFLGDLYDVGDTYTPTVTSVTLNYGDAYPTIAFTGPGTIYALKNFSTQQEIYFTGLTLVAGEKAYLKFTQGGIESFYSSERGNQSLMNKIASGSSPTLKLRQGVNYISLFIYGGTTAATAASIVYLDGYRSLDVGVIR